MQHLLVFHFFMYCILYVSEARAIAAQMVLVRAARRYDA